MSPSHQGFHTTKRQVYPQPQPQIAVGHQFTNTVQSIVFRRSIYYHWFLCLFEQYSHFDLSWLSKNAVNRLIVQALYRDCFILNKTWRHRSTFSLHMLNVFTALMRLLLTLLHLYCLFTIVLQIALMFKHRIDIKTIIYTCTIAVVYIDSYYNKPISIHSFCLSDNSEQLQECSPFQIGFCFLFDYDYWYAHYDCLTQYRKAFTQNSTSCNLSFSQNTEEKLAFKCILFNH